MTKATRRFRTPLLVVAAVAVLATAATCAGDKQEASTTASPTPTPACLAAELMPSYLPAGVSEVGRAPLVGDPDHVATWAGGAILVQVVDGISADRGDDPDARTTTVRGSQAQYGPIPVESDTYEVVNWDEESPCGLHQHAVIAKGIDSDEVLKVARSLEETD